MTILTANILSEDAHKLSELANRNIDSLNGTCQQHDDIQDYYLGMLRKQSIILQDISKIILNRDMQYISTPFILIRSLLDDFLHVLYLEFHKDFKEEIIKINATSQLHSFDAISRLTISNHKHFNGNYPFYSTIEEFNKLKENFRNKAENFKYFKNILNFKFKKIISLTDLVNKIDCPKSVEVFKDRAFFYWKEFSDFIHYSNYSFYYELNDDYRELNLQKIDESFQYCYNTIYLSFKYFERNLKISFVNSAELMGKYGIIHKC